MTRSNKDGCIIHFLFPSTKHKDITVSSFAYNGTTPPSTQQYFPPRKGESALGGRVAGWFWVAGEKQCARSWSCLAYVGEINNSWLWKALTAWRLGSGGLGGVKWVVGWLGSSGWCTCVGVDVNFAAAAQVQLWHSPPPPLPKISFAFLLPYEAGNRIWQTHTKTHTPTHTPAPTDKLIYTAAFWAGLINFWIPIEIVFAQLLPLAFFAYPCVSSWAVGLIHRRQRTNCSSSHTHKQAKSLASFLFYYVLGFPLLCLLNTLRNES